ncbi:50S ribosomal protein L1, partial [bacterium]|nr:50S ribosomal protein L1 [bacterium]
MKRGKRMTAAAAAIDRERLYTPLEAMKLAKELAPANFDET